MLPLVWMTDERVLRDKNFYKVIRNVRGGSFDRILDSMVFLGILYTLLIISGKTMGFVAPPVNPGWNLPNHLYDSPGLVRPLECRTELFTGSPTQSLKTWKDRNQSNLLDSHILVKSRSELIIWRG